MKKIFGVIVAVALVIPLAFGTAFGASAKATCGVDTLVSVGQSAGPVDLTDTAEIEGLNWTDIFTQEMHCANKKDLFIDVSLECGLYTRTRVKTKGGVEDTASADAGLRVRVLLDGGPVAGGSFALPDHGALLMTDPAAAPAEAGLGAGVSFCRRFQQLSAKLQGILTCPPGAAIPTECTLEDEEIELILSTLSAHSFNFIAPDVSSGTHTITVQAVAITSQEVGEGDSAAYAGAGSVTMEEVRMIKDEDTGVPSI